MDKTLSIQDFALYLGAPCEIVAAGLMASEIGVIEAVSAQRGSVRSQGLYFPPEQVKPILRPLSSLTESEKDELWHVNFSRGVREMDSLYNGIGTPEIWRWLLAHHFDLFGWIEQNLAIDATKTQSGQ